MLLLKSPEREEKLEQLERILQSRALQGAENLKAFLSYVVRKAVDHQENFVKEYTIGVEVFGRQTNYDPRSDSVVRVQARRLRSKLEEYYSTEGKSDLILIDLPKGHYNPVFTYARNASAPATAPLKQPSSQEVDLQAVAPLWGGFLRSPEHILVAFSNTLFHGTAETGMKLLRPLDIPVSSIGSPAMPQSPIAVEGGVPVVTEHYTGVGEVMGVYFLGDFFYKMGHTFRVKRSLLLNWDDLKAENLVILGSPAENFLMRELPQEQDFVFRLLSDDKDNMTFGLVNTKPKPGEQAVYLARQEGPSRSQISEDYALISLLRGLDPDHRLMILAGVTTFGTQAAAEYVTRPECIKDLISRLNTSAENDTPRLPSSYQIIIKVKVNGGVPIQISYVTHHILD